jgi:hypothetical protein
MAAWLFVAKASYPRIRMIACQISCCSYGLVFLGNGFRKIISAATGSIPLPQKQKINISGKRGLQTHAVQLAF